MGGLGRPSPPIPCFTRNWGAFLSSSALQREQARTVREEAVVSARARRPALVQQLQVAGVDRVGLVRRDADQLAVADVVGPRRTAVGLARERVALRRGLRRPRSTQAA